MNENKTTQATGEAGGPEDGCMSYETYLEMLRGCGEFPESEGIE
jgi:hypothetical protein